MKRIVFFSPYFYPYTSGITTYPFKLLTHLSKNHSVTVLTFPHINKLKKNELVAGMRIIRMPYLFKISKGFISPQSLIYFLIHVTKNDFVVINVPNFEGLLLAIFAKLLNKNIVCLFHCKVFLPDSFLNRIISFFLNTSIYIQCQVASTIVAYTQDYVNSISSMKRFSGKIRITPPLLQIVPSTFKIKKLIKNDNKIIIGFAGRVAREKGIEFLLTAAESLSRNYDIELLFAGPYGAQVAGEGDYYNQINQIIKERKLTVTFLGNLRDKTLEKFYRLIDLLLLPSINQTEAFGMVQVEAMLCGTPVVASNLPGVREPIRRTGMGIVVAPKNESALQEAIIEVLRHHKKYSNDKNIKIAQKIYSTEATLAFYDKLFR